MKRLYNVTVATDIIVVAESEDEAEELAIQALDDSDPEDFGASASTFTHYPGGWSDGSIPFGYRDPASPDRCVGGWIEIGAAPEHTSQMEAREKLRAGKKTP